MNNKKGAKERADIIGMSFGQLHQEVAISHSPGREKEFNKGKIDACPVKLG